MNRADYPTYNRAVEFYLQNKISSFKYNSKSKELSRNEKLLLKARELSYAKKWRSVIELLGSMSSECDFLNGEKNLLLACACSYTSDFESAIRFNLKAFSFFKMINDEKGMFSSQYNLSTAFNRRGEMGAAFEAICLAEKFAQDDSQRASVARGKACYYSRKNEYEKAIFYIEEAIGFLEEDTLKSYVVKSVASDIYFAAGEEDKGLSLLNELENSKCNYDKERIKFNLKLMKTRKEKGRIGSIPYSIKSSKEYTLQWEILKSIQEYNITRANRLWNELKDLCPDIYGENFECRFESFSKGIFMTYLRELTAEYHQFKNRNSNKTAIRVLIKGKLKELYNLISSSQMPVRKEELIEQLWETTYDPKYDARFYQLVRRLKSEYGVTIVNKNNSYLVA